MGMASPRKTKADPQAWRQAQPAPVMLLRGPEDFVAIRVIDQIRSTLKDQHPDLESHRISAAEYTSGQLMVLASPSLFGENKLVIIDDLQKMTDAFLTEMMQYLDDINPDVTIICRHTGGNRGQRLTTAMNKKATVIACDAIKTDKEKSAFIQAEFKSVRRRIEPEAVKALMDAVGSATSELASAISQLVADTEGTITEGVVDQYYGGRVQATAFKVADAAMEGRLAESITLLRHALATGISEVAVTSALAMKTRQVARIIDGRMGQGQAAQVLGLPPWQVQRVLATTRFWTAPKIADAIEAVAQADAEVKGLSRSPAYAVEKMVTSVASSARRR